eukprot:m.54870 g.54870  ORF g.54870 m.54870 type:complete len:242 (-) comp13273_c0_seq2:1134-1859(-)
MADVSPPWTVEQVGDVPKKEAVQWIQEHATFTLLVAHKMNGQVASIAKARKKEEIVAAYKELTETKAYATAEQRDADRLVYDMQKSQLKEAQDADRAKALAERKAEQEAAAAKKAGKADEEVAEEDGVRVWETSMPKTDGLPACNHVKGRHILCAKRSVIVEAYKKIGGHGKVSLTAFGNVAKDLSECSSGKKGGDLGWFARGKMEGKFQEVAFGTPKGEMSEPFKGANGFHLFYCEDRKA